MASVDEPADIDDEVYIAAIRAVDDGAAPPNIPFDVIAGWTHNWQRCIGTGGFGDVFEGSFWDSVRRRYIALAIKRLAEVALRGDELAMFRHDALACVQREINLLRAFRHPHLIRLLGYACPPNPAAEHVLRLCLVYEFASEGGLDAHLADDDKASDLTWSSRLRIASKIASVIHHLHTHVPGHPAYHRDIKSANIALTATLQPKLIDCGLAKYLPAADVGIERSVFTRVGQRPGTPIYSCPVYLQRGRYDAKSDIYSFGIVMAELLTGKLQSETQNIFHQDSPSTLQSDPRAGEWPTDLVEHLRNLIAQCVGPVPTRPVAMRLVLQRLRELTRGYCAPEDPRKLERDERVYDELAQLRYRLGGTSLETPDLAPGPVSPAGSSAASAEQIECGVCFDLVPSNGGLKCRAGKHFFCDEHFEQSVRHQCSADYAANFRRHNAAIVCEYCLAEDNTHGNTQTDHMRIAFGDRDVINHCGDQCLKEYQNAARDLVREAAVREVEQRFQRQIASLREDADKLTGNDATDLRRVAAHRATIAETILTHHCPRCQIAVFDWDGCFAVTCSNCRAGFCGWCLADCGTDAHTHVRSCRHNLNNGDVFGTKAQFDAVQAYQRHQAFLAYLDREVAAGDRQSVVHACTSDLRDLGIDLQNPPRPPVMAAPRDPMALGAHAGGPDEREPRPRRAVMAMQRRAAPRPAVAAAGDVADGVAAGVGGPARPVRAAPVPVARDPNRPPLVIRRPPPWPDAAPPAVAAPPRELPPHLRTSNRDVHQPVDEPVDNRPRFHSGEYLPSQTRRSAVRFEWTCCLARDRNAPGCVAI